MNVLTDVFFFKQKTAYDMRMSDWSSDVCSSDLADSRARAHHRRRIAGKPAACPAGRAARPCRRGPLAAAPPDGLPPGAGQYRAGGDGAHLQLRRRHRSEEHTSELQSLMRISYAVFCLKKKQRNTRKSTHIHTKKNKNQR